MRENHEEVGVEVDGRLYDGRGNRLLHGIGPSLEVGRVHGRFADLGVVVEGVERCFRCAADVCGAHATAPSVRGDATSYMAVLACACIAVWLPPSRHASCRCAAGHAVSVPFTEREREGEREGEGEGEKKGEGKGEGRVCASRVCERVSE